MKNLDAHQVALSKLWTVQTEVALAVALANEATRRGAWMHRLDLLRQLDAISAEINASVSIVVTSTLESDDDACYLSTEAR